MGVLGETRHTGLLLELWGGCYIEVYCWNCGVGVLGETRHTGLLLELWGGELWETRHIGLLLELWGGCSGGNGNMTKLQSEDRLFALRRETDTKKENYALMHFS